MLPKFFTQEIFSHLLKTGIVLVVMLLIYVGIYAIFGRKITQEKSKERFRVRLLYVVFILFLFMVTKIWVDGFSNLFYGISLVSAGLVVTNKESIMNFVGAMIIRWRGLFVEGDYIQIDKYSGFVHELGVMYFKLFEVSETSIRRSSGRMVKIPNGLIINNPVINYSLQNNVIEYKQSWIVTADSDIDLAKELIAHHARSVVYQFYEQNDHYNRRAMRRNCRRLARLIDLEVHVKTQMHFDKPAGVELIVSYYCFPHDKDLLDEAVRLNVLRAIRKNDQVQLSFAT